MTFDNLELQNGSFYGFWVGLRYTFQERIAPKSIEIDMEKLHMKFSALNVDFDGPSFYFLGSRKLRMRPLKSGIPVKVFILPLLASLSRKQLIV